MARSDQSSPIVSLKNIEHTFRSNRAQSVKVLSNLNFDVNAGECVALLGPSGSGKTTLLRMIAGLIRPHNGTISVLGTPPTPGNCGLIFQANNCFPWLTVRENVAFALTPQQRDKQSQLISETIEAVNLRMAADDYPVHLSGGMQQRAALARLLLTDKQLWLLDEPFNALDPPSRTRMRSLLYSQARRSGRAVILVTHDIDEALEESDRVIMLTGKPTSVAFTIQDVIKIRYVPQALAEQRRSLAELYEWDSGCLTDHSSALRNSHE